jgi:hypothetical protein
MSAAKSDRDTIAALKRENEELRRRLYVRHDYGPTDDRDGIYHPGCGADDTRDSRGEKLRPRFNEGGEPCWM